MEELKAIGTYQEFKKALDTELYNQAEGFVRTGYLLKVARDTDILKESGYKSVAEFAQAEYGLTKDVVSRYISINDRYSEDGYSEHLQTKYQGYGVAKLQDMLTLPDAIIEIMSPEMTRKEIQEVKREYKEEETNPMASLMETPILEQTDMTTLQQAVHQYLYDNRTDFVQGFDVAMRTETEKEDAVNGILDSFAPSGVGIKNVRIQGIGRVMVSFRGKDSEVEVLVVRTQERTSYSWEKLIGELRDLFTLAAGESGVQAWERIYGEQYETEKEEIVPVQPAAEPPKQKKQSMVTNAPKKSEYVAPEIVPAEQEPERIPPEDVEIVENTKSETDFEGNETVLAENETETVENDTENVLDAAEILNAEPDFTECGACKFFGKPADAPKTVEKSCMWVPSSENGYEKPCVALENALNATEDEDLGRLTESDGLGKWGVRGLPWKELQVGQTITREISEKLYGCLCKLKDYENTGLSPEEVERLQEDR